jgi:hypothetical protein
MDPMNWLNLAAMAVWGAVSAQLFLQALLASANLGIALAAYWKRLLSSQRFMAATLASSLALLIFACLLLLGFYLLARFSFGGTSTEWLDYGAFFVLSTVATAPRLWGKVKKHWHDCSAPAAPDLDIALRKFNSGQ